MAGVYTVSQINAYIRNLFVRDYALSNICVRGEVSNCKYHTSGHIYFTLKDKDAAISCVMFAREREGLLFRLRDGLLIDAGGQISVYEKSGTYQLYVRKATLSGLGVLYERFEALKAELSEMGMFDPRYKKEIPRYARRIGIVTAPTGAAIQDICNIVHRRNPYIELILYPALVQGSGAKESIVKGIRTLDAMGLDVLIVGRGGGSIEDLWAFNEECVARAVFDAETPVISAVGHETDYTITDFVADMRAPTPSAAAELAAFSYRDFEEELSSLESALRREITGKLALIKKELRERELSLKLFQPDTRLSEEKRRLQEIRERMETFLSQRISDVSLRLSGARQELDQHMEGRMRETRHRLELLMGRLEGLSPLARLKGGYAWLSAGDAGPVTSVSQLKKGDEFTAYLADGRIRAGVLSLEEDPLQND
ncbi:MAG: exodeoxyribonuclease VII large subunit [Eubacteriales bacterium]|nr:exodeoxyribonuclease VII large subunit [Eubacteriales bacterium]